MGIYGEFINIDKVIQSENQEAVCLRKDILKADTIKLF